MDHTQCNIPLYFISSSKLEPFPLIVFVSCIVILFLLPWISAKHFVNSSLFGSGAFNPNPTFGAHPIPGMPGLLPNINAVSGNGMHTDSQLNGGVSGNGAPRYGEPGWSIRPRGIHFDTFAATEVILPRGEISYEELEVKERLGKG